MTKTLTPDDFRARLAIDRSDIDTMLEDHPILTLEVGEMQTAAIAVRDAMKLELEELHAYLDQKIRHDAAVAEEKTTEKAIENQIVNSKEMKALQRKYLDAKAEADSWGPMREAVNQRSYALRALVDLDLKRMSIELNMGAIERTTNEHRQKVGEVARNKDRGTVGRVRGRT
jgi:hypothetical protein